MPVNPPGECRNKKPKSNISVKDWIILSSIRQHPIHSILISILSVCLICIIVFTSKDTYDRQIKHEIAMAEHIAKCQKAGGIVINHYSSSIPVCVKEIKING